MDQFHDDTPIWDAEDKVKDLQQALDTEKRTNGLLRAELEELQKAISEINERMKRIYKTPLRG